MKLTQFKKNLGQLSSLVFIQPNGHVVPLHFHLTEAGLSTKHFIDCGGTKREEKRITLQLWVAHDYEHRLDPAKLLTILKQFEMQFGSDDLDIEIEYQNETIGRYGLDFNGTHFLLKAKQTDCLASDHCGIPAEKIKLPLAELQSEACCSPKSGCC